MCGTTKKSIRKYTVRLVVVQRITKLFHEWLFHTELFYAWLVAIICVAY